MLRNKSTQVNWQHVRFIDLNNGMIGLYSINPSIDSEKLRKAFTNKKRNTTDDRLMQPYLNAIESVKGYQDPCQIPRHITLQTNAGGLKSKLNYMFRNEYPNGIVFEGIPENILDFTIIKYQFDPNTMVIEPNPEFPIDFSDVITKLKNDAEFNDTFDTAYMEPHIFITPKEKYRHDDAAHLFTHLYPDIYIYLHEIPGFSYQISDKEKYTLYWNDDLSYYFMGVKGELENQYFHVTYLSPHSMLVEPNLDTVQPLNINLIQILRKLIPEKMQGVAHENQTENIATNHTFEIFNSNKENNNNLLTASQIFTHFSNSEADTAAITLPSQGPDHKRKRDEEEVAKLTKKTAS